MGKLDWESSRRKLCFVSGCLTLDTTRHLRVLWELSSEPLHQDFYYPGFITGYAVRR